MVVVAPGGTILRMLTCIVLLWMLQLEPNLGSDILRYNTCYCVHNLLKYVMVPLNVTLIGIGIEVTY